MSRPKVLSIVGPGRSGTTILASILGETEGVVTVGELRWLWRRGLLERRPCGCGLPPDECPVWSKAVAQALEGTSAAPADVAVAQNEVAARRHRVRAIRGGLAGDPGWPALQLVRDGTAHLVPAVVEVTGARVVVDSSKRAQDAAVLAGLDDVDHYVLHMVRDPGAVAFSWGRRDRTIRTGGGDSRAMGTRGLLSSLSRWIENSLGAEYLRRRLPADRWLFLRYEDFAADPRASIARILDFVGEPGRPPFLDSSSLVLHENHTVAGNPNRFKLGEVAVRLDDEWRTRLSLGRQLAVRLLCWPFLLRYGYPLRLRATVRPPAA